MPPLPLAHTLLVDRQEEKWPQPMQCREWIVFGGYWGKTQCFWNILYLDNDHGKDPGVDEVLDSVADRVDGVKPSLEVGVNVPNNLIILLYNKSRRPRWEFIKENKKVRKQENNNSTKKAIKKTRT